MLVSALYPYYNPSKFLFDNYFYYKNRKFHGKNGELKNFRQNNENHDGKTEMHYKWAMSVYVFHPLYLPEEKA